MAQAARSAAAASAAAARPRGGASFDSLDDGLVLSILERVPSIWER